VSGSEMSPLVEGAAETRLVAPELVQREAEGLRLRGGRCAECGALSFPKAQVCTECLSLDVQDAALSNEGVLYSYSRVHLAPKGWDLPYVLGYVDLPEGVRVLSHIDDKKIAPVVGARVRLGERRVGVAEDGVVQTTYVFSPIEGERS
jgi:uncharacterized OB-fold protein